MIADTIFLEDCQYLLHGGVRCIVVAEVALEVFIRPLLIALIPPLSQIGCFAAFWVKFHEEIRLVHRVLLQRGVRRVILERHDERVGYDFWDDLQEDVSL